jgi:hypothetical protein
MTNFIYQSKINNTINNTDTEASSQANSQDILGSVNKLDVSSSPALTKSNNYLRSSVNTIGIETITNPTFLCDLLMAAKNLECNNPPIACPEGKSPTFNAETGSISCACASDKKINNSDNLIDKLTNSEDLVKVLRECNDTIYQNIFIACLGPSFFHELDSVGSPELHIDKVIKDAIENYKNNINNTKPDDLYREIERLKTAIYTASSEPNPSAEAALDHLMSRINECKEDTDQNCIAKTWPSPTTLKTILDNVSLPKTCESQPKNSPDYTETIDSKGSKLNEETCECECDEGYQYCSLTQVCTKCVEGAILYERPPSFFFETGYCECDCSPNKQTYKLPDGTTSPCVDPCQEGYVFSKVPCNTPASVIENPTTSECYGCICKKTTGTWPFSKTETVTDNCTEIENSEPRPEKNCECDCKRGTVRHENPYRDNQYGDLWKEKYRCEPPCELGTTYSWNHRKCIENDCYKRYHDDNPNNQPPYECENGKELDENCNCNCPAGTVWVQGSGSNNGSCDCLPGKSKIFNPNRPNVPSINPVYGKDYVCVNCGPNEVYSWEQKRCILIASGPNNNLRSININSSNFNIINNIEVL